MKAAGRGACAALVVAVLAACTSPGSMVAPPGYLPARQSPPRLDPGGILLLYSHGSRQEFLRDPCYPGSVTTPRWLRDFADTRIAGLPVSVYALCTPTRVGDYHHEARSGRPKVEQRARDLERAVQDFARRGFAPGRIFLLGHSAGGWASLWAARDGVPAVAGVIAFAPAFAGPRSSRPDGWQWLRDHHAEVLQRSAYLPALVFAYRGDPFEDPATLAFLRAIPGVELVVLAVAGCDDRDPHRAVFSRCVMDARARTRMRAFIEHRLSARAHATMAGSVAPPPVRAAPGNR